MNPQSKSRFWSASAWKARLKRGDSAESTTSTVDEFLSAHSSMATNKTDQTEVGEDLADEQTGVLTRYSSSVYSKDEDGCSMVLPSFDNKREGMKEQHLVSPNCRHSRPYAVSSGEWVFVSTSDSSLGSVGRVLSLDDLNEVQLAYSFEGVLKVFIKVYAMAKVMQVIFLNFGAELDDTETDLTYWINRAETEVRSGELAVLIEIVENLFYALYSRMIIEMAGIELCALFKIELRPATGSRKFHLPDPNHMYRIFLACKDNLDNYNVCELLQEGIVHKWQDAFVRRLAAKEAEKGFNPDDMLGYRRFAQNVVSDHLSAYVSKWCSLVPFFPSIPNEILIIMSEKWFTIVPKATPPDDIPVSELPFIDLKLVNPAQWEKELILDHRLASLGKLEGRSIGDERRDDPKSRLLYLAKCHKCICTSTCLCSKECTHYVESACPCSERYVRLMTARLSKEPGPFDFSARANTAARACWEGLAMLRRDVSDEAFLLEWSESFAVFKLEIQKERWSKQARGE